jgi:sugar phosphate isomerase/epimerase
LPDGCPIEEAQIPFAHRLGAPIVVLGCANAALYAPGDDPAKRTVRAAIDRTICNLSDYAAPKGIKIALKVHPGAAENAAAALRTLAAVDRPNVGVNFDTANIFIYNRDLGAAGAARQLQAIAKHVFHVHLCCCFRLRLTWL